MVKFHSDSRNEKSELVQTLLSVIQADKTDGFLHQNLVESSFDSALEINWFEVEICCMRCP